MGMVISRLLGALIVSLSRQGILFWLALTILGGAAGYSGILLSQPAADVLTALIAGGFFYKALYQEIRSF